MTTTHAPRSIDRDSEDTRIYPAVHHALLIGMAISTALFAIGVTLALLHVRSGPFVVDASRHYDLHNFIPGLLTLDPVAIMVLATIVLISTPISRVFVALYAFIREGDRPFTWITLFVVAALAVTLFLGLTGRLV